MSGRLGKPVLVGGLKYGFKLVSVGAELEGNFGLSIVVDESVPDGS